jgi:hypothetical protein
MIYSRRHLRFGWWSLAAYLTLGMVLDAFHGLKVGFYLDVDNETRRLMWTLAHAHGTLAALINIAFGSSLRLMTEWPAERLRLASISLLVGSTLLPIGFLTGGVIVQGGDPGISVLIVPAAGALLVLAVVLIAAGTATLKRQ